MDGSTVQSTTSIAPLILLPAQQQPPKGDDKEDFFATLFTPPTPRASPSQTPEPTVYRPGQSRHARTESTDSEFGAFVSVPAAEDPLRLANGPEPAAFSPLHNLEFYDKFTGDAKVASERKRREVLDELLEHEDDPLYWLQGTGTTMNHFGTSTPHSTHETQGVSQSASAFAEDSLIDLESPSEPTGAKPPSPPATRNDSGRSSRSSSVSRDFLNGMDSLHDDMESERQTRQMPHTSPHRLADSAHIRSPSLPPSSPTRPLEPTIQRTQSSYFTPASFPSRWVSTLLSSTIRSPRVGTPGTTPPAESTSAKPLISHHDIGPTFASHPHGHPALDDLYRQPSSSSLSPSRFGTLSRSVPHSRAATFSEGVPPLDAAITHGTPFASHPYIPPSGAPGFAGDRQWDKGFEFDKTRVERQSVRLTGRKEMTVPVLSVELADMLRPFFSALARLPKSWSLLYSLDQHGISLNTLYTRCQDFKGSALFVVRDAGEGVFGAWMGDGIHPSKGTYYGSGESFLWKKMAKDRVQVFRWTGRNDYVALCEADYISFGGGEGHYGLWLDDTLMEGSSARCPTFDNEPLCSPGPRKGETVTFECVGLEVWGIG